MNNRIVKRYIEKLMNMILSVFKTKMITESVTEESVTKNYFPRLDRCSKGESEKKPKPLRILYAALVYDYGKRGQGLSAEENFFYDSLVNMGMQIVKFDYKTIANKYGSRKMNAMLEEAIYRYDPDLLFTVLFKDELDRHVISDISADTRTITLNWFCDDQWRFETYSKYWAKAFNWVVTTHRNVLPKYAEIGYKNVIHSQWACNPNLYKKIDLPYQYDVSFVGQSFGSRRKIIAKLRDAGISVSTWGFGWPQGRATLREMVRIFNQSKINLDLSEFSRGGKGIKARPFEIAGSGGFVLTEYLAELSEYFEIGKEVECYKDIGELIDKIRWYLAHEVDRQRIAENGFAKVQSEHTYQKRFSDIFAIIGLK